MSSMLKQTAYNDFKSLFTHFVYSLIVLSTYSDLKKVLNRFIFLQYLTKANSTQKSLRTLI